MRQIKRGFKRPVRCKTDFCRTEAARSFTFRTICCRSFSPARWPGGFNDHGASGYRITTGSYEAVDFDTLITVQDGKYVYATPTTVAEGYAVMLHKIKTTYPNAKLLMMNIPHVAWQDKVAERGVELPKYNELIAKMAAHYGVTLVDLYSTEISGDSTSNRAAYALGDEIHPNCAGHDVMTRALADALKTVYLP